MLQANRLLRVVAGLAALVALTACDKAPRDVSPWSRTIPKLAGESLAALALDAQGEPAITGVLLNGNDLSPATPVGDSQGIFLSMLRDTGEDLWRGKNRGQSLYGRGVALAPNGDVLLLGTFAGTLNLGGQDLVSVGQTTFLARFDPRGKPLWSKAFGGTTMGTAFGLSVATSASGDAVIGGYFAGAVDFGGGPLEGDVRTAFIARFDEGGNPLWSRALRGGDHQVNAVAIDATGSVVAAGNGGGELGFEAPAGNTTSPPNAFVARLAPDGQPIFLARMAGTITGGTPVITGLAADAAGEIVFSGSFAGTIAFGSSELTASPGFDPFVAKLSKAGQPLWLSHFGGASGNANAVAIGPDGRIYTTGYYQAGQLDVGGLTLGPATGTAMFLAELDAAGTATDARIFNNGAQFSTGRALAVDPAGALVIAGHFQGDIALDDRTLTSDPNGSSFLARLALPFASHRRE